MSEQETAVTGSDAGRTPSARDRLSAALAEAAEQAGQTGDATLSARFLAVRARLDDDVRVALTGMVKAGKSTLLNALVGEQIAPTDAGECTRVVTWYRFGRRPRVELHLRDGSSRELPVHRTDGRLVLDLDGEVEEAVDHLEVHWPSRRLEGLVLIDTPGIASITTELSARSTSALAGEAAAPIADAMVQLVRHVHAPDVELLTAFRDAAPVAERMPAAVLVLARADELGGGRISALVSARDVAQRYRTDPALRDLALDVLPVAGLIAQAARTLREREFQALREFAALDRQQRERLLVSADRFAGETDALTSGPEVRREILRRLGVFGVRLSAALLRERPLDATGLATELARRSGLEALVQAIQVHMLDRADGLRVRSALVDLDPLIRDAGANAAVTALAETVAEVRAGLRDREELSLLAALPALGDQLPEGFEEDARRALGGRGTAARTAEPADAGSPDAVPDLACWRRFSNDPLTPLSQVRLARAVVRSIEAETRGSGPLLANLPLRAEPAAGGR